MTLYRESDIIARAFTNEFIAVVTETVWAHGACMQYVYAKGQDDDLSTLKRRWGFMGEAVAYMDQQTFAALPALPED